MIETLEGAICIQLCEGPVLSGFQVPVVQTETKHITILLFLETIKIYTNCIFSFDCPTVRGANCPPPKKQTVGPRGPIRATRGAKIDKFCNNDRMKHSNVVFIVCSHKLSCLVGGIFEQTTLFGCQQQLSVLVHHHPPSWLAKLVRDILLDEPSCFYGFCMQFRDPPSHILKSIQS